jgi:peptidyl-prolyl cis-trans isomerase A (cyclophilin A)
MVNPMEEAIVRCKTTAGTFSVKLNRAWSPNGYDRAVELFERHFYDGSHFFRVVKGFLVQFGISYSEDKELQHFAKSTIQDDPPKGIKFKPGVVSFAGSGDNSRSSHLFISYGSSKALGTQKWVRKNM